MTRWVEAIHTDLSNDQWRTYIPVDLTEDTLGECLGGDGDGFVGLRVNPDAPDEITRVRISRIVACRTVSERPTPAAGRVVSLRGDDVTRMFASPGTWIG